MTRYTFLKQELSKARLTGFLIMDLKEAQANKSMSMYSVKISTKLRVDILCTLRMECAELLILMVKENPSNILSK